MAFNSMLPPEKIALQRFYTILLSVGNLRVVTPSAVITFKTVNLHPHTQVNRTLSGEFDKTTDGVVLTRSHYLTFR
jgi:hypothetical protein